MKSNGIIYRVIFINTAGSNDRTTKIPSDIFGNCFRVSKVGLGIDLEAIVMDSIYKSFNLFVSRTINSLHLIKQSCTKSIA